MTFLLSFLTGPNGIYALLVAAIGIALAWMRRSTIKSERAKAAQAEAKARDIADQVENDIGAMTPEQRREALRKWAR